MDEVTTAIIAALATGIATGVGTSATDIVSRKALSDAYTALKMKITEKFGADKELVEAIEKLENKPTSAGWKETLQDKVQATGADQDPEIVAAAQALLDQLKAQPGGKQNIQTAIGSYIAQADRGGQASVNINQPPKDEYE